MTKWFWKLILLADRRINDKWLGGYDEYISGRCYRKPDDGYGICRWLCKGLNSVDPDHCRNAYYADRLRNPDLPI